MKSGLWYHGKQLYQPNSGLAGINKVNKLSKCQSIETEIQANSFTRFTSWHL